jgi:hypothetical protein
LSNLTLTEVNQTRPLCRADLFFRICHIIFRQEVAKV